MRALKKSYLPLISIVAVFLVLVLIGAKIPEETIRQTIQDAGPWGVLLLIFFFLIANVFAPLSGSPLLFAGFYSYGQMVVVYAFIAAIIASITNFWIAKIWGRRIVKKLAGEDGLEKIDGLASNYGLQTLFVFRLFLKEFHDVISYAFGLTKLKFIPYFVVSTLGMIPATAVWYLISLLIHNAVIFTAISWLIPTTSLTVYVIWVKMVKKMKKRKT